MTAARVIDDGQLRAVVRPDLGAGLARFDLHDGTPLFRPAPDNTTEPFALANILLVPWSNRIGGSEFSYGGEYYALSPNVPGEALPLHGSGFQHPWRVTQASAMRVDLELECDTPAPFRYTARASYGVQDGALCMTLSVVNVSGTALPFGLGFHPWLPRTPRTTLHMPATGVWLTDAQLLPTRRVPISATPDWDFATSRPLPQTFIGNAFTGWWHRATIAWPERNLALDIEAGPGLDTCIVYSPDGNCDFLCVEPVTHPPNAHNLPGGPLANGLVELLTDEEFAVECRFTPRPI